MLLLPSPAEDASRGGLDEKVRQLVKPPGCSVVAQPDLRRGAGPTRRWLPRIAPLGQALHLQNVSNRIAKILRVIPITQAMCSYADKHLDIYS